MTHIVPYLAVSDAREAIKYYERVFKAELDESEFFEMEDGRIGHATMRIGDVQFFVSDEYPDVGANAPSSLGGTTVGLIIFVASADNTYAMGVDAGGTPDRPVSNNNGHRSGWFYDPWGHRWSPTSDEIPEDD